ncbi:arsenic resistance protein [Legionella pneumophila serogroup 1]|uniref:arsenic resistance protein n=1 Tax=Legionella pneumophila TaxID=446 RepID=UPI0005191954|nr:arsenic resistance protein [Legionella pneumophila]MCZ4678739.1 arsenic resistance protein [Legionella pneumophila]MCZ4703513.1 arsenic resistance protein [Legionella pneumophila]MCZ4738876.1 arsenic resistance protein [Legionella pneumophila]MCZ4750512.1 arsenic resistance protein [Legionella pneumophila]MDI9827300.1 arsenic resistance protein [Legionella pneumophila]
MEKIQKIKEVLENRQIIFYFLAIGIAAVTALLISGTSILEQGINPALAFMLFVTFLQVPFGELKQAFGQIRFLAILLVMNFIAIPLVVMGLMPFVPVDAMVRLGVLLVLLTPCVDYVVTFSYLGRADARLLLAATPILLLVQMLLLPVYLGLFLNKNAALLIQTGPFLQAFVGLIVIPLLFAFLIQLWASQSSIGRRLFSLLGVLPVPATALVLFLVVAAVAPTIGGAADEVIQVLPVYITFAIIAPVIGWLFSRMFNLSVSASRSIAFSISTRNSLVVLPLVFAVPDAIPVLPAVVITQTLVELISELVYVRLFPVLIK